MPAAGAQESAGGLFGKSKETQESGESGAESGEKSEGGGLLGSEGGEGGGLFGGGGSGGEDLFGSGEKSDEGGDGGLFGGEKSSESEGSGGAKNSSDQLFGSANESQGSAPPKAPPPPPPPRQKCVPGKAHGWGRSWSLCGSCCCHDPQKSTETSLSGRLLRVTKYFSGRWFQTWDVSFNHTWADDYLFEKYFLGWV